MENKNETVKLKQKDGKDPKKASAVEFSVKRANALLLLPNSQWELADDKYKWNGSEIATTATKPETTKKEA